jgi:hypothetical protein
MRRAATLIPVAVALCATASFAQAPGVSDVLKRAAASALAFNRTVPLLAADERADDVARGFGLQSSDTPGMEVAGKTDVGLLKGVIVIASHDAGWHAFRDVHEVNTRVVHDQRGRLERLFREGGPSAQPEIEAINKASRRWLVGSVPRTFNVPTFPLMLLFAENQPRFTYKKTGEKTVDGVRTWVIAFEETQSPTLVVTANGEEYPIHGEFWIDPASGQLIKSRMIVENLKPAAGSQADAERYRPRMTIDVAFRLDAQLGRWVPVEMKELYVKATEQVTCKARYSDFRILTR